MMGQHWYGISGRRIALAAFLVFTVGTFVCGVVPCHSAEKLYESRLDEGLFNTEPYSYLLITTAYQDKARAKELLDLAKRYSPDLPAVYFELAREEVGPSPNGILQGLDYLRQGMRTYWRNFLWTFSIAGLTSAGLFLSFILSLMIVLIIRLPMDAGLIFHEGREEKKRLLLLLIPAFLSFFGPVALTAGVFFLAGLYFKKENKVVVYTSLLVFIFTPFLLAEISPFLTSPSPLKAVVAVNEGKDNRYALWALKGRSDFPSAFSYALALKREGHCQEAIEAYRGIAGRLPSPDARVLINLGNAYYCTKDMESAKDAYEKSIGISPLPSAYYNLSQLYREMLDFTKGDEYFFGAAKLSPEAVSRFASIASGNPNRFVVDEPLPFRAIWEYALKGQGGSLSGLQMFVLALAVAMVPGFYFLNKKAKHRAQRCKRCGSVFCTRCSRTAVWGEMCSLCYGSLIKIDETDTRERVARLFSIYESQTRRRNTAKLLSSVVPGGGQIYSGKILAGFLFLWPFLFCLALLVLNFVIPGGGVFPFSHSWIPPVTVIIMALVYAGALFHIRRRIHKGWL